MVEAGALRRARTRAAILDALEQQLHDRPFEAVAVADIADDAAVSIGSVYGHFGNKTRLGLALALERIRPELSQAHRQVRAGTPLRRALEFGDLLARAADITPAAVHLVCHPLDAYEELIAANDPAAPAAQQLLRLFERFERDLDVAESCGGLANGDTAESVRSGLLATWLGLLQAAAPGSVVETRPGSIAGVWAGLRRTLAAAGD